MKQEFEEAGVERSERLAFSGASGTSVASTTKTERPMEFVEMRQNKILLEIGVLEAAKLLDVLLEVTSQWDLLDTVPFSASYEEVTELRESMFRILEKAPMS